MESIVFTAFTYLIFGACAILGAWSLYDILVSLAGLRRPVGPPPARPRRRFAVVVAAHDEEAVIGKTVESLRGQDYPAELFEVFVVADRCSDDTAAVARAAGGTVFERIDPEGASGKSAALRWLLQRIEERGETFDAICVFDADNLAIPGFLSAMNRHLEAGDRCIQGYLDVKNPEDSWVSGAIAVAYWTTNRLWQAAHGRLGLSTSLGGTGFCIDWELGKRLAFSGDCLTEDLDLQMKLLLEGVRPKWSHEARTFDEKPLSLGASAKQRLRWMRGHWDVARRMTWPLFKRAVTKLDWPAFDAMLYALHPLRTVGGCVALIAVSFSPLVGNAPPSFFWIFGFTAALYLGYLAHFCFAGMPGLGMLLERVPLRYWRFYPFAYVYGLTWIPIAFWGLLTSKRSTWTHTTHVRSVSISERLPALAGDDA